MDVTGDRFFQDGEDMAICNHWPSYKPVEIICESSEFSVDAVG
jgi:hypothetical protein